MPLGIHCPVVNHAVTTGAWNTRANIASVSKCHDLLKIHVTYKHSIYLSFFLSKRITININVRGRSLFISWGGGVWAILGGEGHEKILPQMGGGVKISLMNPWGGGVTNMISISFLWHQNALASGGLRPQTPSHIINLFIFHAPLFTTTTEKCRHEEICIC